MREKMSKQPPPAPTASATGPCPTIIQISRTPQHWKFIQHFRTTRPPPILHWECLVGYHSCPMWIDWLVGCFGFNGPLRQYFSLYRAVSQREGEIEEKRINESKNVQTTPTRYKRSRPLPYCNPNCRAPRHWKFTQHHRTTTVLCGTNEIVIPAQCRQTFYQDNFLIFV